MSEESPRAASVRSRPHPVMWCCAAFFAAMAGLFVWSTATDPSQSHVSPLFNLLFQCFEFAFFFGIGLTCGGYALSGEVIADADGLRWRRWRRWESAPWSEVSDYYLEATGRYGATQPTHAQRRLRGRSPRSSVRGVVLLRDGRKCVIASDWNHAADLRAAVEKHAVATETSKWAPLGTRTADFPKTFEYSAKQIRGMRRLAAFSALFPLVMLGGSAYLAFGPDDGKTPEVFGRFMGLVGALEAGFFFWLTSGVFRDAFATQQRLGERWTIHREGFKFSGLDGQSVAVPWESVVGYDFLMGGNKIRQAAKPYSLRTDDGRIFTFLPTLQGSRLLMHIVRERAVNGVEARLAYNTHNALGGVRARWTGGDEGIGDRIYHARIRSNFSGLLTALVVVALPATMLYIATHVWHLTFSDLPVLFFVTYGVAALALLSSAYTLWYAFTARAIVTDEVLDWREPFRRRIVRWEDIRRCEEPLSAVLRLDIEGHKPLSLPMGRLAYGSELRGIFEERTRQRALAAATPQSRNGRESSSEAAGKWEASAEQAEVSIVSHR